MKEFKSKDRPFYECEICEMGYRDVETAELCEQYCNTHESCSLEITRKAIYRPPVEIMP